MLKHIRLTDWNCYLLERAVLLKYYYEQKRFSYNTNYSKAYHKQQYIRSLVNLYYKLRKCHDSINLRTNVIQRLIRDLRVLQYVDKKNHGIANDYYNPHFYKGTFDKLYI